MGLPLQYSEIIRNNLQRFKVLFKSNNAQISPLLSGSKSFGEPVMIFPDRTGNLVGFDIFASSKNYNVIIVGPPGSGKSVLMNKISQSYLGTSALIRLVDIGDSYRDFTYRLGGKFIEADDEDKLCLNFFTKIITKRIYDDILEQDVIKVHGHELTTIVPIIGRMLKTDLRSSFSESDSVDDSLDKKMMVTILEEAIQEAYDRQKSAAGMQTIWEVLQDYRAHYENAEKSDIVMLLDGMIIGLHDYVIRDLGNGKTSVGKNFNFFNGVNNLDFEKDLFTFEMEKLTKKGEDILEIVSMSVLHQIANEAYFIKGKRKIVGMDETARLLANPLFVNYIDDFSRRIRKYDGALVLLTQYVKDFNKNDAAKTLFEGASLKMFPEQSSEAIQDAVDSGMLGLSDGATELMKSTKAKTPFYNEVCIKIDDSLLVVLNKLDVLNYWLFTTNPKDKAKILNYERKYNLEESEGAWMCGLLQKGLNEEDAYKEVLNKRKVA
jgi:conjugal transfer ATP-binding protein TraC